MFLTYVPTPVIEKLVADWSQRAQPGIGAGVINAYVAIRRVLDFSEQLVVLIRIFDINGISSRRQYQRIVLSVDVDVVGHASLEAHVAAVKLRKRKPHNRPLYGSRTHRIGNDTP